MSQQGTSGESLTQKTVINLAWASSGTLARLVIRIAVIAILSRLLLPQDFGIISTAFIVIGFAELFANCGFGPAIVQRSELDDTHLRTALWLSLLLGAVFYAALFALAPILASFFKMQPLTAVLRWTGIVFIVHGFNVVPMALLQRNMRFRVLSITQFIAYLIGYAVVGIWLAYLWRSVWALVAAHICQTVILCVANMVYQPFSKKVEINCAAVRDLISFGGGLTLSRIANYLALQGDYFVISRWLGAEALGLYTRAYQLMALPANLLGESGDKVGFSSMSRIQYQADRLSNAFRRGMGLISLFVLPFSGFMCVLAPEIANVLLGPGWKDMTTTFATLSAFMFFRAGYKLSATVLRSQGAVTSLALLQAVYMVLVVAGAFLAKDYGIVGVAVAVSIALAMHFILLSVKALTYTTIRRVELISICIPHLALSATTTGISFAIATWTRGLGCMPMTVLLLSAGAFLCTFVVLVLFLPGIVGKDNYWWICQVAPKLRLRKRFNRQFSIVDS